MILTEEEARTKWCPDVRWVYNTSELTLNRPGKWATERCIASDCMMWRWTAERGRTASGEPVPVLGYCGKGGKP